MKTKRLQKKAGFTLFELLVSISIIGILTALGVTSFSNAQKKARDARRISDLDAIQKAAEQYYSGNNYTYPASGSGGFGTYLQNFPLDPKTNSAYPYIAVGAGSTGYCAWTQMENLTAGNCVQASNTCDSIQWSGIGGTGSAYCVKNQQ